jgi:hypothetical protein
LASAQQAGSRKPEAAEPSAPYLALPKEARIRQRGTTEGRAVSEANISSLDPSSP